MARLLAPAGYSAKLELENETLHGTVELLAGHHPTGLLMDASASLQTGGFPRSGGEVGVMRGRLDNNYEIALLDTHVEHFFPGRTRLTAGLALVGWKVPDDLRFDSAEFQVGGLTELATVRPLVDVQMPMPLSGALPFSARWNVDSEQQWQSDDGDEITLRFIVEFDYRGHYGLILTTSPVMRVRGHARTPEEWLRDYVVPMAELTTLATNRPQQVTWVELGTASDQHSLATAQLFSHEIKEHAVYAAEEPDRPITETHGGLIPLGPGGCDLAAVLARWRHLRDRHRSFHDYLVMTRTAPDTRPRAHLLTVVPALEALHDQLNGPPQAGHAEQTRNRVLNRIYALLQHIGIDRSGLTLEDVDFLERRLPGEQGYLLANGSKPWWSPTSAPNFEHCSWDS